MWPAPTSGSACATLNFDGTNATSVDAIATQNINALNAGFTLSVWVQRANPAGEDRPWETIIDFGNGAGDENIVVAFDIPDGASTYPMALEVYQGAGGNDYVHILHGEQGFPHGQWVSVQVTQDASGIAKIYWDGVEKATGGTAPLPLPVARSGLYVGHSHWEDDPYYEEYPSFQGRFQGMMQDLFVFNMALSPEQLTALREQRTFPTIDGTLTEPFLPVPPGFVHGNITDTILGSLHLAVCDERGATLGLLFDVFSGDIHCTVTSGSGPSERAPCDQALPAAQVALSEDTAGCLLDRMECGYMLTRTFPAPRAAAPPDAYVPVSMQRFNVSVAGARLSFVRDVVDAPEPVQASAADCAPLSRWPRAQRACETWAAVLRGEQALDAWIRLPVAERVAVTAYLTRGNTSRQMHFFNVRIDRLGPRTAQADVHGLLGQRAVRPAPLAAAGELHSGHGGLAQLAELSGSAALSTFGAEEGVAATGGTLRATVEASGHQGEGAIDGTFRDYQVKWVSSHDYEHSRFACERPQQVEAA